jgi:hypothetical protein
MSVGDSGAVPARSFHIRNGACSKAGNAKAGLAQKLALLKNRLAQKK